MELKLLTMQFHRYSAWSFNRTLWNWNNLSPAIPEIAWTLLIVPYGIETCNTIKNWIIWWTFNRTLWNWNMKRFWFLTNHSTFNRTLWNWNHEDSMYSHWKRTLLIVPYGIETQYTSACHQVQDLLIVPYGIETP